jgi:hypothetical protein
MLEPIKEIFTRYGNLSIDKANEQAADYQSKLACNLSFRTGSLSQGSSPALLKA